MRVGRSDSRPGTAVYFFFLVGAGALGFLSAVSDLRVQGSQHGLGLVGELTGGRKLQILLEASMVPGTRCHLTVGRDGSLADQVDAVTW